MTTIIVICHPFSKHEDSMVWDKFSVSNKEGWIGDTCFKYITPDCDPNKIRALLIDGYINISCYPSDKLHDMLHDRLEVTRKRKQL